MSQMRGVLVRRLTVLCAAASLLALTLYRAVSFLTAVQYDADLFVIAAGAVGSVIVACAALLLDAGKVRRIAVELLTLGVALLAAEIVLEQAFPARAINITVQRVLATEAAARKHGIAFDARLRSEAVRALQAEGVDALAGVVSGWASDPLVSGRLPPGFYPLSNASSAEVVECNEGPGYVQFETDEYGFHNPASLVASNAVEIAVVGESHALGRCVPSEQSAIAIVRRTYPRTANFAITNARILTELAIFREYVQPLQPRTVLWFVHADLADPGREANEPKLTRYFDPSFSQGLMHRQQEIDQVIRQLFVVWQQDQDAQARRDFLELEARPLTRTLKLPEVRRLLDESINLDAIVDWPRRDKFADFGRVMRLAQSAAARWGGTLVVVMVPSYDATLGPPQARAQYEHVAAISQALGLRVVDGAAAFRAQTDPLDLYMLGMENHPSERGHAVLAQAILKQLRMGEHK